MRFDAPLIITGAPRSGTTGLQIALSALKGVCIWYETELYSQIHHPYTIIEDRGGRLTQNGRHQNKCTRQELEAAPMLLRNPIAEYTPYAEIMERFLKRFGLGANQQHMIEFFFDWANAENGPLRLYGDKTPREYARQLPQLVEAFPKCKIIFCMRDGRDMASSRARREDGKTAVWAAGRWIWINEMYREALDTCPAVAEQSMIVRMEDAAENVNGTLGRIADLVGLDLSAEDYATFSKFYHPTNIGRWKRDEPNIEAEAGDKFVQALRYWGYK